MDDLTDKQRKVLDYVIAYAKENGFSPTTREIAWQFGSPNTTVANNHLKHLATKGYISRIPKCVRAIKVLRLPDEISPSPNLAE